MLKSFSLNHSSTTGLGGSHVDGSPSEATRRADCVSLPLPASLRRVTEPRFCPNNNNFGLLGSEFDDKSEFRFGSIGSDRNHEES